MGFRGLSLCASLCTVFAAALKLATHGFWNHSSRKQHAEFTHLEKRSCAQPPTGRNMHVDRCSWPQRFLVNHLALGLRHVVSMRSLG